MGLDVNSLSGGKSVYKAPLNLLTIHDMGIVFLGLLLFRLCFFPLLLGPIYPNFFLETLFPDSCCSREAEHRPLIKSPWVRKI